mmetsp:Transcript_65703/g.182913  ORF Transcript_65703/g.182913 Transcript_65703/m.182913 type:complete len:80 (+) Transcript_65703:1234-1473(+)
MPKHSESLGGDESQSNSHRVSCMSLAAAVTPTRSEDKSYGLESNVAAGATCRAKLESMLLRALAARPFATSVLLWDLLS